MLLFLTTNMAAVTSLANQQYQRTLLMHKLVSGGLLKKQTQVEFERTSSQNQFLSILSETQDQKLEKVCQKFSSWVQFPSGPFATRHICYCAFQ